MTTPGYNLHRRAASQMFKVREADVTPSMIALARNALRASLISSVPDEREVIHIGVGFERLHLAERRKTLGAWPLCPNCKQSCTGIYASVPGCTRCGQMTVRPGTF